MPVLMQQPAVGREQNDLGRVVQVVRRGGQDHVGEAGSSRRDQETCQAEDRREFLGCWCGRAADLRTATVRRRESRSKSAAYSPVRRSAGGGRTRPRCVHPHPDRRSTCTWLRVPGSWPPCSGYGRTFRQHSRPWSSRTIRVSRSTRQETGFPGQNEELESKTTRARTPCQAARRHQSRADGRRRASMMAATGKPRESSGRCR